jgi:hypothetical protein
MIPHRCPVCGGLGTVPAGFYTATLEHGALHWSGSSAADREPCRSCDQGIVWGPDTATVPVPVGAEVPPLRFTLPFTGGGSVVQPCARCGGRLGACACYTTLCAATH